MLVLCTRRLVHCWPNYFRKIYINIVTKIVIKIKNCWRFKIHQYERHLTSDCRTNLISLHSSWFRTLMQANFNSSQNTHPNSKPPSSRSNGNDMHIRVIFLLPRYQTAPPTMRPGARILRPHLPRPNRTAVNVALGPVMASCDGIRLGRHWLLVAAVVVVQNHGHCRRLYFVGDQRLFVDVDWQRLGVHEAQSVPLVAFVPFINRSV